MAEMNLMPLGEQENNELLRQAVAGILLRESSCHRGLHRMIAIDLKVGEFKPRRWTK